MSARDDRSGRARRPKHLRAKVGDVVKITWLDHCTHGSLWEYLAEAKEHTPLTCTSFGQVITSEEDYLNLVQTTAENVVFNTFTIIRATITKIEVWS